MKNIDETMIRTAIAGLAVERLLANVPQSDLLPALGLVSKLELAQMMGINYSTMRSYVGNGRIPRPTIRLNRRAYYTREDAEAIVKSWNKN